MYKAIVAGLAIAVAGPASAATRTFEVDLGLNATGDAWSLLGVAPQGSATAYFSVDTDLPAVGSGSYSSYDYAYLPYVMFGIDVGPAHIAIDPGLNPGQRIFVRDGHAGSIDQIILDGWLKTADTDLALTTNIDTMQLLFQDLATATITSAGYAAFDNLAGFGEHGFLLVLRNGLSYGEVSGSVTAVRELPAASGPRVIPLPASLPLMTSGLAALTLLGRRWRRRSR